MMNHVNRTDMSRREWCVRWAALLGGVAAWRTGMADEPMSAAGAQDWPMVRGDRSASGVAWAMLPEKLRRIWTSENRDDGFAQTPVIGDGRLFAGSVMGDLVALDAATGEPLWRIPTELGFLASPTVATSAEWGGDGFVVAGDTAGVVRRYDAATGEVAWKFTTDGEISSAPVLLRAVDHPGLECDVVVIGSQDCFLYALAVADGRVVWKYENPDQIRCFPTVAANRILIAGCDGVLHQIGITNGESLAQTPLDAPTGNAPAVLGDRIFVGTEGRQFLAIDLRRAERVGELLPVSNENSSKKTGGESGLPTSIRCSAAVRDGLGVVATQNRLVYGFDPATMAILWEASLRGRIEASPVLCGDRVYIGGMDGRLYVLGAADGQLIETHEPGGRIRAGVAIATDRLYVGNDAGDLFCFG